MEAFDIGMMEGMEKIALSKELVERAAEKMKLKSGDQLRKRIAMRGMHRRAGPKGIGHDSFPRWFGGDGSSAWQHRNMAKLEKKVPGDNTLSWGRKGGGKTSRNPYWGA